MIMMIVVVTMISIIFIMIVVIIVSVIFIVVVISMVLIICIGIVIIIVLMIWIILGLRANSMIPAIIHKIPAKKLEVSNAIRLIR